MGFWNRRERIVERLSDWRVSGTHVDESLLRVENVVLAGPESRNGYRYAEAALRGAVPLYEGKPVFLDHAINSSKPYERSARDLVGSVRNVRFEGDRVRGDIHVLDTDSGRTFLALAEAGSASVGMSHVVLASRNREKTIVERIEDVISVDAVVFPATTSTFREQHREGEMILVSGSYEAVIEGLDGALAAVDETLQRVAVWEDYVAVRTEADQFEIREWWEEESGEFAVSEVVMGVTEDELHSGEWWSLIGAEADDEESVEETVQELRNQLKMLMERSTPTSWSRGSGVGLSERELFLRAIRG